MTALHRAWINEQADKAKRDQGFHPLYWQFDQATQGWWLMRKRTAMERTRFTALSMRPKQNWPVLCTAYRLSN